MCPQGKKSSVSDLDPGIIRQLPPHALLSVPFDLHVREMDWFADRAFLDSLHKHVTSGASFEAVSEDVKNSASAHDDRYQCSLQSMCWTYANDMFVQAKIGIRQCSKRIQVFAARGTSVP